jgi:hypothetical protein
MCWMAVKNAGEFTKMNILSDPNGTPGVAMLAHCVA